MSAPDRHPESATTTTTGTPRAPRRAGAVANATIPGPHFPIPGTTMHPLRFAPILKRLIWGGRRLGTVLRKPIGAGSDYAESWEVSDHRHDVSIVADGPLAGASLRDLIRQRSDELLGPALAGLDQFPLLVKFIDANQVLSVQVHPDDERGHRLANDNGKTETWVVVDAEPGSLIYAGLKPGVTRDDFAAAIEAGTVEPLLHKIPATAGDCILIPAGIVHAIGAGVMLAEIQQMSDATFRVFDWNRPGADGKPRTLHVDAAIASTDFSAGPVEPLRPTPEPTEGGTIERLSRTEFFALERLRLTGEGCVGRPDRFTLVLVLGGDVEIRTPEVTMWACFGETILLPASLGECRVIPVNGSATLVTCHVP